MRRLRTVHGVLQEANGLGLLADPLMEKATAEIVSGTRLRHDIQRDIKQKERARDMLVKKYKTSSLPEVSSFRGRVCFHAARTLCQSASHLHYDSVYTHKSSCQCAPADACQISENNAQESAIAEQGLVACPSWTACMSGHHIVGMVCTSFSQCIVCAGGHSAVSLLHLRQQLLPAIQSGSRGPHD